METEYASNKVHELCDEGEYEKAWAYWKLCGYSDT